MTARIDQVAGVTFHARRGAIENAFRYTVDYVVLDAEADVRAPWPFVRNRRGAVALHDTDHGGAPGQGRGAVWVREVLQTHQLPAPARIELMAQPRMFGHVFNPVCFWLIRGADGALWAVIAEVSNTFGDRHSYLCHHEDLRPIAPDDRLQARKVFHVSPFQPVAGDYTFRFDIRDDRVGVWIDHRNGEGGLYATLTGTRRAATTAGLIRAALRRPLGSRRVVALIHWQALKLWWKGAGYRVRPEPPAEEVSR